MTALTDWERQALRLAYAAEPKGGRDPEPVLDYDGQLLARESIARQLGCKVDRAKGAAVSAVRQWATTGKWPRAGRGWQFFVREALLAALDGYTGAERKGSKAEGFHGPPWSTEKAAWLADDVVAEWFAHRSEAWLHQAVEEEFEKAENVFRLMHPFE